MVHVAHNNQDHQPAPMIPEGEYLASITGSSKKPNSRNTGELLVLEVQIDASVPIHGGRKLAYTLNYWHTNETAQRIARADFTKVCEAVGQPGVSDTSEIHGLPVMVQIGHDKRRDDPTELYPKIVGFSAVQRGGAPSPSTRPTFQGGASSAPPASAPPPSS